MVRLKREKPLPETEENQAASLQRKTRARWEPLHGSFCAKEVRHGIANIVCDVIAVRGGVPPPQKRVGNSVWKADTKGLLDKKCTLVIFYIDPAWKRNFVFIATFINFLPHAPPFSNNLGTKTIYIYYVRRLQIKGEETSFFLTFFVGRSDTAGRHITNIRALDLSVNGGKNHDARSPVSEKSSTPGTLVKKIESQWEIFLCKKVKRENFFCAPSTFFMKWGRVDQWCFMLLYTKQYFPKIIYGFLYQLTRFLFQKMAKTWLSV